MEIRIFDARTNLLFYKYRSSPAVRTYNLSSFIFLPPASASMFLVPPHVRIVAERSVELGEESVEIGKKMLGKQDETIDAIEGVSEKIDRSYTIGCL